MSTLPSMTPVDPAQPSYSPFELGKLAQYPQPGLSREQFEAAHGFQPPPFDPGRKAKNWWNSSVVADYEYTAFDFVAGRFVNVKMGKEEASTPNFPGEYRYLPYDPVSPAMYGTATAAYVICTEAEATALLAELTDAFQRSVGLDPDPGFTPFKLYVDQLVHDQIQWNGETGKDVYRILYPDTSSANCEELRGRKFGGGVGAPGEWVFTPPSFVVQWRKVEVPTTAESVPMPMRAMLENESGPRAAGVGGWVVDIAGAGGGDPGGSYTEFDRERDTVAAQQTAELHKMFVRTSGG